MRKCSGDCWLPETPVWRTRQSTRWRTSRHGRAATPPRQAPFSRLPLPPLQTFCRTADRGRLGLPELVARLGFERDSWVTSIDARRVQPEEDSGKVAAEQVRSLLRRLPARASSPLFVFDAGYDPVRLQLDLEGCCVQLLVRLSSGRVFYADPERPAKRSIGRDLTATARSSTSRTPRPDPSLPASTTA